MNTTSTKTTSMKPYAYWLHTLPGIGTRTINTLLDSFSPEELFSSVPEKELEGLLEPAQLQTLCESRAHCDPEQAYKELATKGIHFTWTGAADYPKRLRSIPDAPFGLYWIGRLPADDRPSVAVVGARMCSEYGRYMARRFGQELALASVQVISGMALGVDGISQKGALQAGGTSFGVLGCGADICYPEENKSLYDALIASGGILSEYPPGTHPKAGLFPQRNRIISGLSDAVLVVEARMRSGTLITVDMALEQGKEVFAVPGRASDRLSDGCNQLIRQGAGIALSASDVLETLYALPPGDDVQEKTADSAALSPLEKRLLALVDLEPKSVASVYEQMQKEQEPQPISLLLNTLIDLCGKGLLFQEAGYFSRRL